MGGPSARQSTKGIGNPALMDSKESDRVMLKEMVNVGEALGSDTLGRHERIN
ncbi:MAG: hypothetical protein IT581_18945 [Verrucomicrobiales bacterium]|nr:hypothetical protein [Verrucomicrobiales bacterium]